MELTVFGIGVGTMNNMLQRTSFYFEGNNYIYLFIFLLEWKFKKNFFILELTHYFYYFSFMLGPTILLY